MQQPVDFFCKEFLPGQHRLEDPISVSIFFGRVVKRELKTPQIESLRALEVQVLSRPPIHGVEATADRHRTFNPVFGEVATTSGSTNSLPRGVTAACRALTLLVLVRIQARQPISRSAAVPAAALRNADRRLNKSGASRLRTCCGSGDPRSFRSVVK